MTDTMDTTDPVCKVMHTPSIIVVWLQNMTTRARFTSALVSKAWAEAATAATRSIILRHQVPDLSSLQRWLEKHGDRIEVFQIHECNTAAALTALPCAKLQNLQLRGKLIIHGQFLSDIAAATKLTSIAMVYVNTPFRQADVVSAPAALPNLEQLTWEIVQCRNGKHCLGNSSLLQRLTRLNSLELSSVSAKGLKHLGSLSQLQHLSVAFASDWFAAGCPGLQELKALTSLGLLHGIIDIPESVSQLTALRQLHVFTATPSALNRLQALPGLTQLRMMRVGHEFLQNPLLQLPVLQHLELGGWYSMLTSSLASLTQLRLLSFCNGNISVCGSLVASTLLQHLKLQGCTLEAAFLGGEDSAAWQQVFPGPGQRLPHLTSLQLSCVRPPLQQADIERVVSCCSSLQVLELDAISLTPALVSLSGLTSLHLVHRIRQQCRERWSDVAALTGLRELTVHSPPEVSADGLRQLTALQQLTSLALVYTCVDDPSKVSPVLREQMSDRLPHNQWLCERRHYAIINQAPAGHPSDVSARLLQACGMAAAGDG